MVGHRASRRRRRRGGVWVFVAEDNVQIHRSSSANSSDIDPLQEAHPPGFKFAEWPDKNRMAYSLAPLLRLLPKLQLNLAIAVYVSLLTIACS